MCLFNKPREARAAFRLRGPHVARILDVDLLDGEPFIVMEYLRGDDLRRLLSRRGPLSVEYAVGLLLQACEAIAEAHDNGIVHRDLKPANLFLVDGTERAPLLKVLDFGISRLTPAAAGADDISELTRGSHILGTPSYVAPEQLRDPRLADGRADLWSLGTILQELLTGVPVFHGRTQIETMTLVLEAEAPPLGAMRPDVPLPLQRVVERCLQKAPEFRFADARELATALVPYAPRWAAPNVARLRARDVTALHTAAARPLRAPSGSRPAPERGATSVVTVALGPGEPPRPQAALALDAGDENTDAAPALRALPKEEPPRPVVRRSSSHAIVLTAWALVGGASGAGAIAIALGGADKPGAAIKRFLARAEGPVEPAPRPRALPPTRGPLVESIQQPRPWLPPAEPPASAALPSSSPPPPHASPARPAARTRMVVRRTKRAKKRAAPAAANLAFVSLPAAEPSPPPEPPPVAATASQDNPLDGRR